MAIPFRVTGMKLVELMRFSYVLTTVEFKFDGQTRTIELYLTREQSFNLKLGQDFYLNVTETPES